MHKPKAAHAQLCALSLVRARCLHGLHWPFCDNTQTEWSRLEKTNKQTATTKEENKPLGVKQTPLGRMENCLCCLCRGAETSSKVSRTAGIVTYDFQVFWEWLRIIEARGCNFGNWYLRVEWEAKRTEEFSSCARQGKYWLNAPSCRRRAPTRGSRQ